MPLTDSSEGFTGLQQWSEPLIFDRLLAAYRRLPGDDALACSLTRLHAGAWRALIARDPNFEALRATLAAAVRPSGLTLDGLAEVDAEILRELLEVVLARYKSSHRMATSYHLALMEIVGRLRPEREARRAAA